MSPNTHLSLSWLLICLVNVGGTLSPSFHVDEALATEFFDVSVAWVSGIFSRTAAKVEQKHSGKDAPIGYPVSYGVCCMPPLAVL